MIKFEKLEKDGKVAVLYSPGFGAGWFTWNREYEGLMFDKEIVELVLQNKITQAIDLASHKYPNIYTSGGEYLSVVWVLKGYRFEINEYDGSESVRILNPDDGHLA